MRSRDLYTPLGRFPERLARYAELSGREIDFDTLLYYSVKTQALVPLSLAPVMENLHAGIEHADVSQCFLCHQTNAWNDIKGVGWYKHH